MLTKRLYYTFLVLLVMFVVIEFVGLVCTPSPSPGHSDQNKTYQESDGPRTTIFFPILRNTLKGINCILDWTNANGTAIVALATIAIALFTWTLWAATAGLLENANKQAVDNLRAIKASERAALAAETAANAAEKSANIAKETVGTMEAQDRAYLFVKVQLNPSVESIEHTYEIITFGSDRPEELIQVEIIVTNYGKTPAILMNVDKISGVYEDRVIDALAQFDTNVVKEKIVSGTEIISSGETKPINDIFFMNEQKREWLKQKNTPYRIVCFGRIQYKDVFGKPHDTIFCWQWGDLKLGFYTDKRDHNRNKQT